MEAAREHLHITNRLGRALDIGCGAGLSTAALESLAETVVGLEPVQAMLTHSRVVAPGALFLVGRAERLPFSAGAFDLIAAAGALNYVDVDLFLPDAVRVLAPGDVKGLAYHRSGLRLEAYTEFEIAVPMTLRTYLPYVLSETRVESAISRGVPETEIRAWCQSTLANVFGDTSRDVLFSAYVAYVSRDGST
jgi:ubiquinone/menaquinone biosynthesis C-methylase UbiE